MPAQRRRDTSQARWRDLIEPLVPPDGHGRLFLELGCNAGYYLRKASEMGYITLGVEREQVYYEQAKYWEAQEPRGVRVEFGDINEYDIPANYITLLANVLYWQTQEQVQALVDKIKERSLHVLIMSRNNPDPRHLSSCALHSMLELFDGWDTLGSCYNIKHYTIILHNPMMLEYDTTELFNLQPFTRSRRFLSSFRDYIDLVLSGKRFRLDNTAYWRYATWRGWRNRTHHMRRLRHMILQAEQNGITEPVIVYENGIMVDGNHRLIIAERLGIPRLICKIQYST